MFAALAYYLNGALALPDAVAADVLAKTPDGEMVTTRRWVLQEHVWTKLFDEAGLTAITTGVRPAITDGLRSADTLPVSVCGPYLAPADSA
ncbi:hypothetical protein ABZ759_30595 [Streptomyces sp. NPDC047860]|uniref:hypothetical protein n=1 Tax=Streptomyces sp. NPDC047860 TaxID=3155743 RepID=UPI0034069A4C